MSNNVEDTFQVIDEITETLEMKLQEPYLECLTISLPFLYTGELPEELDDLQIKKIEKSTKDFRIDEMDKEIIRKATQLALLKAMKDTTQQQHVMTPDTVAMVIGYLVQKLTNKSEKLRLFDPACGVGNLLTAVLNQLKMEIESYGSEVDPTLVQLALANANLQKNSIEFFHQDSLRPFLLEPVDVIISDLPVGYYPDDIQASNYELNIEESHAYSHHLFIEQSINYTKAGGYLVFVIPSFLFTSEYADQLHTYLHKVAHIVGVLELPESMFKNERNQKSILILQKKDEDTTPPKQVLMAKLPSFKNVQATEQVLAKINHWFKEEGY
ncbi:class I SAM-dependent methyltransferase [Saliterribacillus persicus]|uniref:Site-specific DNA-methyltransferase (Adenine-specific) n=1 Tax=Saliterribacillus persicus TaxID=930114 RepID=A0A368XGZ9_9BACI|nr:class I SAM-dependent methyltransferase [Saliterribacillus persicus]RCW66298.1 site-specific DNA-methyltransferase (adenine-specific) [Saliterribacillus persicus]